MNNNSISYFSFLVMEFRSFEHLRRASLDECVGESHPSMEVLEQVFVEEMVHKFYHFEPDAINYTYKFTLHYKDAVVYVHFAHLQKKH